SYLGSVFSPCPHQLCLIHRFQPTTIATITSHPPKVPTLLEYIHQTMDDCMEQCCGQLVFRCLLTSFVLFVDSQIVERRDTIIHVGRLAQTNLHVPECLCVFTNEDPGMTDDNIRITGEVLMVSYFFAAMGLFLVAPKKGTLWDVYALGLGIVNPACVGFVMWLYLLLSKRERLSRAMHGQKEPPPRKVNSSLEEIWSAPLLI
ncbi:hypothetical protein B0T10DRAFT_73083, partial [Thelonectria olida]